MTGTIVTGQHRDEPAILTSQHVERLDLFVYGTLLPGEERWGFLEPYVASSGRRLVIPGDLYDTGYGYPAAVFETDARYRGGSITGRRFAIVPERYDEAIELLDRVEGAVEGMYERVRIGIDDGDRIWAYQVGDAAGFDTATDLTPIEDGDWCRWRRVSAR